MSIIFRLLKLVNPFKWWMLLAAFLAFLTIGSSVGLLMTSAYIIAKAALHPSIAELQVGIVGVRFFGITRGIFRYLERLISHKTTFNLLAHFRVTFFKAFKNLSPAQIIYYKSADLFDRIFADIQYLENFYVRAIAPPLVALISSVAVWLLFGMFSSVLAIILLGFHLLAGFILPYFTYKIHSGIEKKILDLKNKINIKLIDNIQGLSELIIFNRQDEYLNELENMDQKLSVLQRFSSNFHLLHEAVVGLLMNGAVVSILIMGDHEIVSNNLPALYLPVLVLGVMASFEMIMPLPDAIRFIDNSERVGRRLFEIMDLSEQEKQTGIKAKNFKNGDIVFEDVHFSYNPDQQSVLNDISMIIKEGSKVAIVGPSGAGKTSFGYLLQGFQKCTKGAITIGGLDIKTIPEDQIQQNIAFIAQNSYAFSGSVAENLRMVAEDAEDEKLISVLRQVQLEQFTSPSAEGLNSWVGEHGSRLSGGERQRLFAARAILKKSPIIIFDEITTGLDSITEENLLNSLFEIFKEKTLIFITHKTTRLSEMDTIFVFNQGKIAEYGTPEKLLAGNGYFKHMYTNQQ